MSNRPSPAFVLATIALFVSLTGFGVAATGGNFILGQSNTADKQTALAGTINGNPVLRAENAGTGSKSDAVFGKIASTAAIGGSAGVRGVNASTDPSAAGVVGKNTGGGPGLSAIVNSGVSPLSVNSSAKVTNLNVDLLDGKDATDFAAASELHSSGRVTVNDPTPGDNLPGIATLFTAGGLVLTAFCYHDYAALHIDWALVLTGSPDTSLSAIRSDGTGIDDPDHPSYIIDLQAPAADNSNVVQSAYFVTADPGSGDVLSGSVSAELNDPGSDCTFAATGIGG